MGFRPGRGDGRKILDRIEFTRVRETAYGPIVTWKFVFNIEVRVELFKTEYDVSGRRLRTTNSKHASGTVRFEFFDLKVEDVWDFLELTFPDANVDDTWTRQHPWEPYEITWECDSRTLTIEYFDDSIPQL